MKRKTSAKAISIILLIFLSLACSISHDIAVKQDGSAAVSLERDGDPSHFDIYFKSQIISNIDSSKYRFTFNISTIDSLGKYLPFHPPGFIQFNWEDNTLRISDSHTQAFEENDLFCCHLFIFIEFSQDIRSIQSLNKNVKQINSRKIEISRSRYQLLKGKKTIDVKITLEPL